MLYNSSIEILLRYRKTRIPWSIFASLALFLCIASATGRWPIDAAEWFLNWGMALCLVVQFRLWDDLADVENDRLIHPGRVLCQTKNHQIFWVIFGLLMIVNGVLVFAFKSYTSLGVFLFLNVSFVIWYSILRILSSNNVVFHSIVLVKYPVFVFLLSGSHFGARAGLPLGYGMLVTFLCFCAYELLHDQRLLANRNAASLLACEFSALLFVAILMLIELRRNESILAFVQAGLLAAGSIILTFLFRQYRRRAAPGLWHFGVFFVAFAWLLNFALGSGGPFDPLRGESSAKSHVNTKLQTGTRI